MAFNVKGAREEGYSDTEIAEYMATEKKFNVKGARADGYSDTEIVDFLTTYEPEPSTFEKVKTAAVQAKDNVVSAVTDPLGKGSEPEQPVASMGDADKVASNTLRAAGPADPAQAANTAMQTRARQFVPVTVKPGQELEWLKQNNPDALNRLRAGTGKPAAEADIAQGTASLDRSVTKQNAENVAAAEAEKANPNTANLKSGLYSATGGLYGAMAATAANLSPYGKEGYSAKKLLELSNKQKEWGKAIQSEASKQNFTDADSKMGWMVDQFLLNAPSTAVTLASIFSPATAPYALGTMAAYSGGGHYTDLVNAGVDNGTATLAALGYGTVEAMIERAIPIEIGQEVLRRFKAMDPLKQAQLGKRIARGVAAGTVAGTGMAGVEGGEETVTGIVQRSIDQAVKQDALNKGQTDVASKVGQEGVYDPDQIINDTMGGIAGGAPVAGAVGAAGGRDAARSVEGMVGDAMMQDVDSRGFVPGAPLGAGPGEADYRAATQQAFGGRAQTIKAEIEARKAKLRGELGMQHPAVNALDDIVAGQAQTPADEINQDDLLDEIGGSDGLLDGATDADVVDPRGAVQAGDLGAGAGNAASAIDGGDVLGSAAEAPAGRSGEDQLSGNASGETSAVDAAAHEAATSPLNDLNEPTAAQKEAGNYRKGSVRIAGMDIAIENPQGSVRRGVSPDGTAWETPLVAHYGYVKGTKAGDGDASDVFIKAGTPDDYRGPVFVIDQINKDGSFDEHKSVIGAATEDEARAMYLGNYEAGWAGLGAITQMPVDAYKSWVRDGVKRKPLGDITAKETNAPQPQEMAPQAGQAQGAQGLSVGTTPRTAEPITVKNGVVFMGGYSAQHFETGEDVTVPDGADNAAIAQALRDAGVLSNRQRIYGLPKAAKPQPAAQPATPAAEVRKARNKRAAVSIKTADDLAAQSRKTFLKAIKDMGGIKSADAADVSGEPAHIANRLSPGLFRKEGNAIDLIARRLNELGYISDRDYNDDVDGGSQAARDLIGQALAGEAVFTPEERERYRELVAKEQELAEGMPARNEALADMAEAEATQGDELDLDALPTMSEADAMRALGITEDEINEQPDTQGRASQAAEGTSEGRTAAGAEAGTGQEGQEGFALEGQSPEQLKRTEQIAKEAAAAKAKKEAEADARAQADAERDSFTLTGSARAADANPGQADIFNQPAREARPSDVSDGSNIAQEGTPKWAADAYLRDEVPDGWYVHGRGGRQDLNTGNVIQMTRSWEVADQYARDRGSRWIIRPSSDAIVLDLSGQHTSDMDRVVAAALDDFETGAHDFGAVVGDIESSIGRDADTADIEAAIRSSFSPENIVNSAEAYDNWSWAGWLADALGVDFVHVKGGAVAIGDYAVDAVKVPADPNDPNIRAKIEAPSSAYVAQPGQPGYTDPYGSLETRPNTRPKQLEAGRAALADVERRILARSVRGAGASLLGSAISRDFRAAGGVSLVGRVARTAQDLATVAQVLRDPRFETVRAFYVDKAGKIIGERAYSSRLPGAAYTPADLHVVLRDDMAAMKADGYWLLHNHPSGSAIASQADLALTANIARMVKGLRGHVIIDHNEYNSITMDGVRAVGEVIKAPELAQPSMYANPEAPHPVLGEAILSPLALASMAKRLQQKDGYAVLIGTDPNGSVTMLTEVPANLLKNGRTSRVAELRTVAAIKRATRETGSYRLFAVVPGRLSEYRPAVESGLFVDVVDSDLRSSAEMGLSSVVDQGIPRTKVEMRGGKSFVKQAEAPYGGPPNRSTNPKRTPPKGGVSTSGPQQALPGTTPAQPPQMTVQPPLGLSGGALGNMASWSAPIDSAFDDFLYKWQDKNIDVRRVVSAITEAAGQLADRWNPYLQETLFHGRAAKRTLDFVDRELKPMVKMMRLRELTMADVDQFLWARHAKEANALIASRDPAMQDGGSGMTDAEVDAYFASLDPSKRKRLESTAAEVDAIIARTRQMYADYGLETQSTVDGWGQMFEHYVPLMREDKDGAMGIGQGYSVKGRESKHRTGSRRKVVDVLANIALQRERAIVRGEKNRVAVALAGLAKLNPNPDFWTFDKVPTERVLNQKTGLVEDRADPLFKSRPNVIVAKIRGRNGRVEERAVVFNESNDRAMRMAESLKNLDIAQLEGLMGVAATITRYFASINTQYNPVFGFVNLTRDVQGALLNLNSTPLKDDKAEVLSHTFSALAGIYRDSRAERRGKIGTSKWALLWEQFTLDGGQTGYRDLYKNSADRARAIELALEPTAWMKTGWGKVFTAGGALKVPLSVAQKAAMPLFDWLSDFNLTMENAVRLSAYKVALERGMSRQQAANLAKNLTVNFNRRGKVGMQVGALYAFFNASVQGTARIAETIAHKDGDRVRLTKAGMAIVGGGVLLGAMQAVLLAAMGFDDDEPPEFVRERNLIIPLKPATGEKNYITIPMPLGYHVFPNIGRILAEAAIYGTDNAAKRASEFIGIVAGAFNPFGSGLNLQLVAPTPLDPLVALAENEDWTGKPIYRQDFGRNETPGFTRTKDTASSYAKALAEGINYAFGGTEYSAGAFSPTPDQIDYLVAQLTGGVGREIGKLEQTVTAMATGEELPAHKVPLLGRYYGSAEGAAGQSARFYENLKRANRHEAEIKGRWRDGEPAGDYLDENPEARRWMVLGNRAERRIEVLRDKKRRLIEKNAPRADVREVEDEIAQRMQEFNEDFAAIER